jgi:LPXTG-motif cell wall-anchored protein
MHASDAAAIVLAIGVLAGIVVLKFRRRKKPDCCK